MPVTKTKCLSSKVYRRDSCGRAGERPAVGFCMKLLTSQRACDLIYNKVHQAYFSSLPCNTIVMSIQALIYFYVPQNN